MELRFWKRLRAEKKFSGPDQLRAQIAKDIASANRFFNATAKIQNLNALGLTVASSYGYSGWYIHKAD